MQHMRMWSLRLMVLVLMLLSGIPGPQASGGVRYFASLTARAGPAKVTEWIKVDVDDQALTPLTCRAKEQAFFEGRNMYVTEQSDRECKCSARYAPLSHCGSMVPTIEKALQTLIKADNAKGGTHIKEAVSRMRGAAVLFIKAGVDLHQELYVRARHASAALTC